MVTIRSEVRWRVRLDHAAMQRRSLTVRGRVVTLSAADRIGRSDPDDELANPSVFPRRVFECFLKWDGLH